MYLTKKQKEIMLVLMKGNPDGTFCDIDELLERLPYPTTKASIQFSIRALIAKEMMKKAGLESRRKRRRIILSPTYEAFEVMRLEGEWPPKQANYHSVENRVKPQNVSNSGSLSSYS